MQMLSDFLRIKKSPQRLTEWLYPDRKREAKAMEKSKHQAGFGMMERVQ
jgi:hypothetical protein